jgi:Carboxypeptidase regulatory-like domain
MGDSMRKVVLGLVVLLTMGDSCNNGVVGNQDYGIVTGRVLDATSNKPIADAIVSVGSLFVITADGQGGFTLPHVPVGLQTVTARMPGFTTTTTQLRVRKDTTAQAGYLRLVPLNKPDAVPTLPPPATPTPLVTIVPTYVPPGVASPSPSLSPSAAPSPSATASMQAQSGQI